MTCAIVVGQLERSPVCKHAYAAVTLFIVIVVGAQVAAERRWQTGTWMQAGINRTVFVRNEAHEGLPPVFNTPARTQVATYVIETDDRRYNLEAVVPIVSDEFARHVTVGSPVTFAVEKKTAYIRFDKGEYRLLVHKDERKKTP